MAHRPPGALWSSDAGCGNVEYEGSDVNPPKYLFLCGTGMVDPVEQRFLTYLTAEDLPDLQ